MRLFRSLIQGIRKADVDDILEERGCPVSPHTLKESSCQKWDSNPRLQRDFDLSNGIGHFKGCGIEAHQNGVLFRMLTYCVVQRRADLPLQPLKNLRCSLPLFKRTVPISPWFSPRRPGFDSRYGKQF